MLPRAGAAVCLEQSPHRHLATIFLCVCVSRVRAWQPARGPRCHTPGLISQHHCLPPVPALWLMTTNDRRLTGRHLGVWGRLRRWSLTATHWPMLQAISTPLSTTCQRSSAWMVRWSWTRIIKMPNTLLPITIAVTRCAPETYIPSSVSRSSLPCISAPFKIAAHAPT